MLLHDNYIPFFVNLQAVVVFHYQPKCTNCIFCFKCISIMADSDKTLIGDGNLSNNNRKTSAPSIVPHSSGTMQPDTHPTHHVAVSESSALKRKQTSFQITSVTVKGSRLSTDGGEDSADDLDESHTEDVSSSEILECSRTTDVENDNVNEVSNVNNDESSSVHAPSNTAKCQMELPVIQDTDDDAKHFPSEASSKDDKTIAPSVMNENSHVVNPPALPDQWQHRFRVVKIVSSEPFKKGRWLCMDFMDPPAPAIESKPEVLESNTGAGIPIISGSCISDTIPGDRVAHIYEISPSDAYPGSISVAVGPDQIQQPMYGIFLPVNNGQYPFISGINTIAIQREIKHTDTTSATTTITTAVQQSQVYTASQITTSEAQTPYKQQGQQAQADTTATSQISVQSAGMVHVPQQQSQPAAISGQTPPSTAQQPSASVSVTTNAETSSPPTTNASVQSAPIVLSQQPQISNQESHISMQSRAQAASQPPVQQSQLLPAAVTAAQVVAISTTSVISSTSQINEMSQTTTSVPISSVSVTQTSSVGTQATAATSDIPESSLKQPEHITAVPSQIVMNPEEVKELGSPSSSQPVQANSQSTQSSNQPVHVNSLSMQSNFQSVQVQPAQTIPQPLQSIPQPIQSAPQPVQPAPQPVQSVPQSISSVSQLTQPVQSAPQPVQTAPQPVQSIPQPNQPVQSIPQPNQPTQSVSQSVQSILQPAQPTQSLSQALPQPTLSNPIQMNLQPTQVNLHPAQVTPQSTQINPLTAQDVPSEVASVKSDINGEDSESAPSGTSTVAIDNKIEQAMDLVKSHLMFAVREEVDVLKEKITELMDRISQLEYENGFLKANATQQTLEQLNQTQLLQQQQQQNQSSVSMNSVQVTPPQTTQQLNIQNTQSTS